MIFNPAYYLALTKKNHFSVIECAFKFLKREYRGAHSTRKKTSFEIYAANSFKASIVLVYCSFTASNCCKASSKLPARKLSVISKLGLYK